MSNFLRRSFKTFCTLSSAFLALGVLTPQPATAKQVCGWYAIVSCSSSLAAAQAATLKHGWGAILETSKYKGLKPGTYCIGSGPQPKASAVRDRKAAIAQGISRSTYIKHACTDERNIGD